MELVEETYRLARCLPDEEKFGLAGQLRRGAVSIPCNIAEGYGRTHRGDYLRHLSFAMGSVKELETLLLISVRLGFLTEAQIPKPWELSQRIGQMLTKLMASLRQGPGR
jgi:four helix bundle protein